MGPNTDWKIRAAQGRLGEGYRRAARYVDDFHPARLAARGHGPQFRLRAVAFARFHFGDKIPWKEFHYRQPQLISPGRTA